MAICARRCNPGWRAGLHYFTLTSGVHISITDRRPHSLDVPAGDFSDGFGDAGGFLDDFTVLSSVKLKMRSYVHGLRVCAGAAGRIIALCTRCGMTRGALLANNALLSQISSAPYPNGGLD
ncbi:hypothetical protein B0H10DRAFT_1952144 [Mycena sp. CBHHK59/15]|nr:hypothetical protein B0H10DRAFT_1952144 [Mycena sp. CBHHK59/15]